MVPLVPFPGAGEHCCDFCDEEYPWGCEERSEEVRLEIRSVEWVEKLC